jgi:nitrate/TMAO reductase-like tetraheme cytochrome c subunit
MSALLLLGPAAVAAGEGDPHAAVFAESLYPSAKSCAPCHQQIYNEWALSSHAYASISPMFNKFEQKINDLTSGTIGNFCMRCHASVGSALGEPRYAALWGRAPVSREGVTCVTCHRVQEEYGKLNNSERWIVPGDIHQPMYGATEGKGLDEVLANKALYKVSTGPAERGTKIHTDVIRFTQLSKSEFCLSCHQVAVHPGIKLEVVWDQYRDSPAFRSGVSCQDCHMSRRQGQPAGFDSAPVAIVDGKPIESDRPHHVHYFAGPGYPIAHPGIFPHNPESEQFTIQEWLTFDYRAGWGTPEFEERLASGSVSAGFPDEWADRTDREEARAIVTLNLAQLKKKRELRKQVMEDGSRVEGPYLSRPPRVKRPLRFAYKVTNLNPGHNLPSGSLGAQPEIWLNVALIDPDGRNIWESGYVDSHGDMADLHSLDVAAGKIERDNQLFNLQTKFLTTNLKGTDREMYLPVPFDGDQLPFIRTAANPNSVMNHPPFIRMEGRSLSPLGSRYARYTVPARLISQPGTYRLAVRLRSRAEPIYFMKFVDSTLEMEQAMNEWMLDFHAYTVEFEVE